MQRTDEPYFRRESVCVWQREREREREFIRKEGHERRIRSLGPEGGIVAGPNGASVKARASEQVSATGTRSPDSAQHGTSSSESTDAVPGRPVLGQHG
jgi:hypothetical protein